MTDHAIELREPLDAPYLAARPVLGEILKAMSKHEAPYERVTLDVDLHDLNLPVDVRAAAPIEITVVPSISSPAERYDITIAGTGPRSAFPTFSGWLMPNPLGTKESELYLKGGYEVPYGLIGASLDATLMHDAAEKSLRRFLQWIAAETARRTERDERARNFYRFHT